MDPIDPAAIITLALSFSTVDIHLICCACRHNLRKALQVRCHLPNRVGHHTSSPVALGAMRGWSVLSTESHASWGSTEYWSVASQHVEDRSTKKEKILTDL
jgi:hypothetical protein